VKVNYIISNRVSQIWSILRSFHYTTSSTSFHESFTSTNKMSFPLLLTIYSYTSVVFIFFSLGFFAKIAWGFWNIDKRKWMGSYWMLSLTRVEWLYFLTQLIVLNFLWCALTFWDRQQTTVRPTCESSSFLIEKIICEFNFATEDWFRLPNWFICIDLV
jgi:hypothetical protein